MIKRYPDQLKRLSFLLRKAGFSEKHPLVLDGKPTISIFVGTYKYEYRYPYRVMSLYPTGRTVAFKGEYQEDTEGGRKRWARMDNPQTVFETEYTAKELDLHWSQAPEYKCWDISGLVKAVCTELPRKTRKPLTGDYYSVEKDKDGRKFVNIHAYFEIGPDKPYLTELTWLREPLKKFVKEYGRDGQEYIDEWYDWVTQYQTDYKSRKEALKTMNSFFDGRPADRILPFKELTGYTRTGHYINIDTFGKQQ